MPRFPLLACILATLAAPILAADAPAKKTPPPPAAVKTKSDGPRWKLEQPSTPPGVTLREDIPAAVYGSREVLIDVYIPEGPGPFPGVLVIHGGGWYKGSITTDKPLAERLATAGYVVTQVAYRLSGEAMFPAALHDAKAAVRWMRANARHIKLDVEHIGVIGGSAGGHLSGLLAMTNNNPQFEGDGGHATFSSSVQACIVMASTMDLHAAYAAKPGEHVLKFLGSDPAAYTLASPIAHVGASSVPTIFIEGEKDTRKIGRPEMQDKLRRHGVRTELYTLKHAPHPFWMSKPWVDESAHIAVTFFDQTLKNRR